MYCGDAVPDLGPLKTKYLCDACSTRVRKYTERTLEAMYAYELAGSEQGARELLSKAYRFPVQAGIENGQSQTTLCILCGKLTKWADMDILSQLRCKACNSPGCPKCGERNCTRNHPEFT
jgi:uncharacterized protein YlaI